MSENLTQNKTQSDPPIQIVNSQWGSTPIPYSQEAEEATLGAMIIGAGLNPSMWITVASFLRAEDFYILRHKYIWQAMVQINERKQPIDYITVMQQLKDNGYLDEIGGPAYLTHLMNNTPSSLRAEVYARIVQGRAWRRRLMVASDHLKGLAIADDLDVEEVKVEIDKKVADLKGVDFGRKETGLRALLHQTMDYVEQRLSNPSLLPGLPFGIRVLDNLILGAERQNLLIFAGAPGMGKTSLMLGGALHQARLGKRVGIITYEMSELEITHRLISIEGNINLKNIRMGDMQGAEHERFVAANGRLSKLENNIFICDTRPTIGGIQSKCLSWINDYGLDTVYVDYLQIIKPDGRFHPNQRTQEVDAFAYGLKNMAGELNISVNAGAQINRKVADRSDKRPDLSDLREAGGIEQAADKVIFIYRDEYYHPETTEFPNQADLIVAKHRNGPTGTVTCYFEKTTTAFKNGADRSINLSKL